MYKPLLFYADLAPFMIGISIDDAVILFKVAAAFDDFDVIEEE